MNPTWAATSWGNNRYDIFTYNGKGEILQLWWSGRWHWSNLGNGFPDNDRFVGPLTAASWGHNRIDVFGLGKEGDILQLWWHGGWRWSNLRHYFGSNLPLSGPLAATSPAPQHLEIFGVAKGGDVWRFWFKDGWHKQNLGNHFPTGERFSGSITAVSWGPDRVDVFGQGTKGQVLQLWRQGDERARWNWTDMSVRYFPTQVIRLGGPITGFSTGHNRIDLFAVGEDRRIWRMFWNNGWKHESVTPGFPEKTVSFGLPHDLGLRSRSTSDYYKFEMAEGIRQNFIGPITAASWGGRRLDIFGFDEKGDVLQMWRENDNSRWVWSNLGNKWSAEELINSLLIEIGVGGDDLRSDSRVHMFLHLRDGRKIRRLLRNNRGWPGKSLQHFSVSFSSPIRLGDILTFSLRHHAGEGGVRHPDNWNMDMIRVNYVGTNKSGTLLYDYGKPLWRFQKNKNQVWEKRIN